MDKFCSLKKYYKEPNKPYNLISTCFFLADNYYKDPIIKYFNGLKITIENFYLHFDKSYYFRIYYDNSLLEKIHKNKVVNDIIDKIKELIDSYKKQERLQLVEYNCKDYRKDKFHFGLFGTIVRFHPLFETGANTKNIILSDIEPVAIYDIKILAEYAKNYSKVKLAWRTHPDKPQKDWLYASAFLSKVKFEPDTLHKFFDDMKIENSRVRKFLKKFEEKLKKRPVIQGRNNYQTMDFSSMNYFTYGVDEAYLNFYLKPIFEEKKYPVLYFAKVHNLYRLFSNHYKKNNKFQNIDKSMNDNINAFYSLIFGPKIIDMNNTAKQNFIKVHNLIYPIFDLELRETISKNIKKNIELIQKNLEKINLNQGDFKSLEYFSSVLDYVFYQEKYTPPPKVTPTDTEVKTKPKEKPKEKTKAKSKKEPKKNK
jgi:hypothetical protein